MINTRRSSRCQLKRELEHNIDKEDPLLSPEEVAMSQELIAKLSGKIHEPEVKREEPKKTKVQRKKIWARAPKEQPYDKNSVEAWIKRLQVESEKEENAGAFVYLRQVDPADPYKLTYCNYNEVESANGRFYTLSKKGFTSYFRGEATEFLTIVEWIMERELYEQIKSFKFFKLFRLWRAIKSWRHNIVSEARKFAKESLERKLMLTKKGISKLLIRHVSYCKQLESQKLMDITEPDEPYNLKQFQAVQNEHMKNMSNKIRDVSLKTKEDFLARISKMLSKLKQKFREEHQEAEREKETAQRQTAKGFAGVVTGPINQQSDFGRLMGIDTVYEHLGFQSNLSYANRTEVRKKCKMFIRLSYLLDFIAKTSLKNLYVNSMKALDKFLETHNDIRIPSKLSELKNTTEYIAQRMGKPILIMQISIRELVIPEDEIKYEMVSQYERPPIGEINESNFDPTCHLQLTKDTKNEEDRSHTITPIFNVKVRSATVNDPVKKWLKVVPDITEFAKTMKQFIGKMLEIIKSYERHTKNECLDPYASVLEEWDEKVADKWEIALDKNLSCEDILIDEQEFINREKILDRHIAKLRDNVGNYLILFNKYLIEYWRYSRIDWSLVTNNALREPVGVITLFVKQIKSQKEDYSLRIPSRAELGFCRLNTQRVRDKMCSAPTQALKKLDVLLVVFG